MSGHDLKTFRGAMAAARSFETEADQLALLKEVSIRLQGANSAIAVDSALQILNAYIARRFGVAEEYHYKP